MFIKKWLSFFAVVQSFCYAENVPEELVERELTQVVQELKVDAVVLGSGVGGLTSAIYLARSGLKTLVVEGKNPGGAIIQSESVQNWPGELEISGMDLIEKMRLQAEQSGASLSSEEVISVDFSAKPFSFIVRRVDEPSKQQKIIADLCVIATGSQAKTLGIPGEKKYWSKGVYTCALCDGSLYRGKTVAVVGGGDSAVLEADYLSGLAKKVYVLVRKGVFRGVESKRREALVRKANVEILYDVEVEDIQGSEAIVEKVVLASQNGEKKVLPVDGVFLAIGSTPNTQLFSSQLALVSGGYIALKEQFETSVPGVYAIGDVVDPVFRQAISAAGDGAKAAIQALSSVSLHAETVSVDSAHVQSKDKENVPPNQLSGKVIEITSAKHLREIMKTSKLPLLVDFYATWCNPCRRLSRFIDEWAQDFQGKVTFCKVNVDVVHDLAKVYGVRSIPTLLRLDSQGKEASRKEGPDQIIQYVNSLKQ